MDIDELRTVQTKERQKDSLQHLRDSFYEDVAAYVAELKERRQAAADEASDPFADSEVSQLTNEIETAEDVVEAVYERRVGKVVKLASFAAADMPIDEEGLTVQERDLFEDLVGRINENKDRVLEILAGEGDSGAAPSPTGATPVGAAPAGTEAEPAATKGATANEHGDPEAAPSPDGATPAAESAESTATPERAEPAVDTGGGAGGPEAGGPESEPESATGGPGDEATTAPEAPPQEPPEELLDEGSGSTDESSEQPDEPPADDGESRGRPDGGVAESPQNPRTTVRITADVGQMLGLDDREYDLRSEDVVALPEANAEALLQREAAEEL
jgi:DNA replication factor GINS